MDKWRDYFWYLLPSPLKIVSQKLNQWYIFFKVLGEEYDQVQAELERAVDETTIATCSDSLLPYFAEDRNLYRYTGESNDSFRSRIAMYDELESLGGTEEGILLAAASVGYNQVEHIWLPELEGDSENWATFLIKVNENLEDDLQLDFQILQKEIRDKKESISQDIYEKHFRVDPVTRIRSWISYEAALECVHGAETQDLVALSADWTSEIALLDPVYQELYCDYLFEAGIYQNKEYLLDYAANLFFYECRRLDGSLLLDGNTDLNAVCGRIEAYCGEEEL